MPTISIAGILWNDLNLSTQQSQVMSAEDFKKNYLWGIPLCNPVTGESLSDEVINNKIKAWQDLFEQEFSLKLFKQRIVESKDLVSEEFMNWGFIKTSWQILNICELKGRFNEREIIQYPKDWLSIRRSNANDNVRWHELYIVPNGNSAMSFNFYNTAFTQYFNFRGARLIPNYWNITYITGFDVIPQGIINLIGLASCIDILAMIEMGISSRGGSAGFGLASQSLSFDGLSQSASKMNGGNIFQQRIKGYNEQLKDLYIKLKGAYKGITFDVA